MAKKENPLSFQSFINFVGDNFSLLLILSAVFITGFAFGSMWKENKILGSQDVPPAGEETVEAPAPEERENQLDLDALPPVTDADMIRGAQDPEIYLVEYSDFNCGYCGRVHTTLERVISEYPNQVAWVFRNLPILTETSNTAAQTNLCALEYGGENAAWSFTDALMVDIHENENRPTTESLISLAGEAGLNTADIQNCLDEGEVEETLDAQIAGARAVGAGGTPTIILVTQDGQKEMVGGAAPYEDFEEAIEKYLN